LAMASAIILVGTTLKNVIGTMVIVVNPHVRPVYILADYMNTNIATLMRYQ